MYRKWNLLMQTFPSFKPACIKSGTPLIEPYAAPEAIPGPQLRLYLILFSHPFPVQNQARGSCRSQSQSQAHS